MKSLVWKSMMLMAGVLMLTSACNQLPKTDEIGTGIAIGTGNVIIKLTDAPFPVSLVEKAMVTIDTIKIRSAENSKVKGQGKGKDKDKEGTYTLLSDKVQEFNLLDLRNGITSDLLEISIGVGTYDLIKMHVIAARVILKDGTEYKMKIPGGSKSGLKINLVPELVVESGVVNEVLLDFDVSKSFIAMGNIKAKHGIKGFIFNPVIRAMVEKHSGTVFGKVFENDTILIEEAHVQILRADTVFSSALTDSTGRYTLIGIPAGNYKMVCEKEGYLSVVADQVKVKERGKTVQNFKLTK